MPSQRTASQVARRALILATIHFRASLEVTDHPRVVELSERLLPWLESMGCGDAIDPIERDLLSTPFGKLSDSQRTDANWAGEGAAFFRWMLGFGEPPDAEGPMDGAEAVDAMHILRPEATALLRSAQLRDRAQVDEVCVHQLLMLSILRESRVPPPASDIVRRASIQSLGDLGQVVTDAVLQRASDGFYRLSPDTRERVAFLYFVRSVAATWFLGDSDRYFS